MTKKRDRLNTGDFPLILITLVLVIFGIVMVFSSSYYYAINKEGNPYSYLIRDAAWAAVGFAVMIVAVMVDYKIYRKLGWPVMIVSLILLALLFTPLGEERNSAVRWLGVGNFTIMPGEIAKIAAIIFVARFFSVKPERIKSFFKGILPMLLLGGIYGVLIMMQPNMSTAITIMGIIVGMMFVAGMNLGYLFGIIAAGGAAAAALIFMDKDGYRLERVTSFLDPFADKMDTGYQVVQSLLALGSGGLFGLGLGKSIQKNLYLPEPQNDFILAIIGEELGLIGVLVLMACYILLIWRGIHIAINAPDRFGMLLASGITLMLGIQVLLNIAVVTSSMPPTGIILPLVSYGGNALVIFMGAIGILLNISRHSAK